MKNLKDTLMNYLFKFNVLPWLNNDILKNIINSDNYFEILDNFFNNLKNNIYSLNIEKIESLLSIIHNLDSDNKDIIIKYFKSDLTFYYICLYVYYSYDATFEQKENFKKLFDFNDSSIYSSENLEGDLYKFSFVMNILNKLDIQEI